MNEIKLPQSTAKVTLPRRVVRGTGKLVSWLFSSAMKLFLIALFVGVGLLVGGFLQFTAKVSDNVQPTDIASAHAIVALTGGSTRIATGLDLLSKRKGNRLLITGVNTSTKKDEIQAMHPQRVNLFDCCVDLERIAKNTIGNAEETAKWMQQHGYQSLIVVTSAYHMPRSLLEYRRQMPNVKLTAYAVPLEALASDGWWKDTATLRFMVNEYLKYLGARARDYVHPEAFDVLRNNLRGGKNN
jgi:uncharacterized SAM-binding protein YcdF (DUF218 family)